MELDDLKAKWQKENNKYSQLNQKSMEQLQIILEGKTSTIVTSLRKNLEKILGSILIGMLGAVLLFPLISDGFTDPGSMRGFVKLVLFYLITIIFYWVRFKKINNLVLHDNIKERMEQLIKLFKRNIKVEVSFILIFCIILIVVGRFIYGPGLDRLDDIGFLISAPLSIVFVASVVFLIISKYKKRIKELEGYLDEYEGKA